MRIEGKRKGKATLGQITKKSRPDLNLSDLDMQNIASYVLPTPNTSVIPSRESLFCDSCDTKFTSKINLVRHRSLKILNEGGQIIPFEAFTHQTMLLLCEDKTCCYSTRELNNYKIHNSTRHKNREYTYKTLLTLNILDLMEPDSTESKHMCPKCLITYSSEVHLRNHAKRCRGSELYNCTVCHSTYSSHQSLIEHLTKWHKPRTKFTCTGIYLDRI